MSRASFHCRARASKSSMFRWIMAKSPPAENTLPAPVITAALTVGSRSTSVPDVGEFGVHRLVGGVHAAVVHGDAQHLRVRPVEAQGGCSGRRGRSWCSLPVRVATGATAFRTAVKRGALGEGRDSHRGRLARTVDCPEAAYIPRTVARGACSAHEDRGATATLLGATNRDAATQQKSLASRPRGDHCLSGSRASAHCFLGRFLPKLRRCHKHRRFFAPGGTGAYPCGGRQKISRLAVGSRRRTLKRAIGSTNA